MGDVKFDIETTYTRKAAIFLALGFEVQPSKYDDPNKIMWGVIGEVYINDKKIDAKTASDMLHRGIPLFDKSEVAIIEDKFMPAYKQLLGIIDRIKWGQYDK
jgi:hypothetical protein